MNWLTVWLSTNLHMCAVRCLLLECSRNETDWVESVKIDNEWMLPGGAD